jgi:hypothetical protein
VGIHAEEALKRLSATDSKVAQVALNGLKLTGGSAVASKKKPSRKN